LDNPNFIKLEIEMNHLRVWWIPQVPGKPFQVAVHNLVEAKLVLDTLARYDNFQYEHHIKPDYCNAGGLQEEDPELGWTDWYPDDKIQAFLDKLYPDLNSNNPLDDLELNQVRQLQQLIDGQSNE
jgi:hypothetical protein